MSNDLSILKTVANVTELSFSTEGAVLSGPQKVSQLFIAFLLTQKGSVRGMPEFGTDFVTRASAGIIKNEFDVAVQISQASTDLYNYMIEAYTGNEDPSEVYKGTKFLGVSTSYDVLQLSLRVITMSNEFLDITIPVIKLKIA